MWEKKEECWLHGRTGPVSAESKIINGPPGEHEEEIYPFGNPFDFCFLLLSIEKSQPITGCLSSMGIYKQFFSVFQFLFVDSDKVLTTFPLSSGVLSNPCYAPPLIHPATSLKLAV